MERRQLILGGAATLTLAALLGFSRHAQSVLEDHLPPRDTSATTPLEGLSRASEWSNSHGGTVYAVLGTGSMAPYIPAAPRGQDPLKTIVAYAVTAPGAAFADIKQGDLCLYVPEWDAKGMVCHVAAQKTGTGWIMSGLANAHSEALNRVTAVNFRGIVARVYVWSSR